MDLEQKSKSKRTLDSIETHPTHFHNAMKLFGGHSLTMTAVKVGEKIEEVDAPLGLTLH